MAISEPRLALDGGGGEESRSVFCLEFVNMNASSQVEKQRNQKLIRSTAMKNFRRRQQSQQRQAKEASRTNSEIRPNHLRQRIKEKKISNREDEEDHKEQHSDIKEEFDPDLQDASTKAVDDWIFDTTSKGSWVESQTAASGNHNEGLWDSKARQFESSRSHPTWNDFFLLNNPLNVLGGGRVDPFRKYPVGYVGPYVHEVIDHCKSRPFPKSYYIFTHGM